MRDGLKWEAKEGRVAEFGNWVIHGTRYESENGEIAWHTISHPQTNEIHDFWVMGEEFRAVVIMQDPCDGSYIRNVQVGDVSKAVDAAERRVVSQAIAKWESERVPQ